MSATLGEGGDLERLTGRQSITRLPVPEGWDRQGIVGRFFIFPEMTSTAEETIELRRTLMTRVPRSVVLVPNDRAKDEVVAGVQSVLGLTVFDATAIEDSKAAFVGSMGAAAVFANRYDGIDFPGDECRLLFLDGLPRTTNAQERFFVARMGANALLQGRIQTRVVQAVGRCTRSLPDYSAVVVTGGELTDYLNSPVKLSFLHPELQAELDFAARQSMNASMKDLVENFDIFLRNDAAWEAVNRQIQMDIQNEDEIRLGNYSDVTDLNSDFSRWVIGAVCVDLAGAFGADRVESTNGAAVVVVRVKQRDSIYGQVWSSQPSRPLTPSVGVFTNFGSGAPTMRTGAGGTCFAVAVASVERPGSKTVASTFTVTTPVKVRVAPSRRASRGCVGMQTPLSLRN